MAPELLEAITFTSILYTVNTHPTISPFYLTTSHLRDTRLSKIGNAPNDPRMTLNTSVVTVPCIHWIPTPKTQISIHFALWPAMFEMQGCWKSEIDSVLLYKPFSRYNVFKNRKCTEWTENDLNHLTVQSYLYTLNNYPGGPYFSEFEGRVVFWIFCSDRVPC